MSRDGKTPTVQRASVEAGRTGGHHSQQCVQLVWALAKGGSLLSPTSHRLEKLAGDTQPAIESAEAEGEGRLRLTWACGSAPLDVEPPIGRASCRERV